MKYTVPVLFVVDLGDGVAFEEASKAKAILNLTDCLHFAAQHECGPMSSNLANGDIGGLDGRRFHVSLDVCWPAELADDATYVRRKRAKRRKRA